MHCQGNAPCNRQDKHLFNANIFCHIPAFKVCARISINALFSPCKCKLLPKASQTSRFTPIAGVYQDGKQNNYLSSALFGLIYFLPLQIDAD